MTTKSSVVSMSGGLVFLEAEKKRATQSPDSTDVRRNPLKLRIPPSPALLRTYSNSRSQMLRYRTAPSPWS